MHGSGFTSQAFSCKVPVGLLWARKGAEELQAAKPSLGSAWMCLAVQVGGAWELGLVKSRKKSNGLGKVRVIGEKSPEFPTFQVCIQTSGMCW